ncbi:35035_t:CDS:2, partial [Racocetra persica]
RMFLNPLNTSQISLSPAYNESEFINLLITMDINESRLSNALAMQLFNPEYDWNDPNFDNNDQFSRSLFNENSYLLSP